MRSGLPLAVMADWGGGGAYFFLRTAPRDTAPVLGRVVPGTELRLLGGRAGTSEGGNPWWYRVADGGQTGYISSNAIEAIGATRVPWIAIATSDGDPQAVAVTAYRAPSLTAPVVATYELGSRFTVLGTQSGDELVAGDTVWYVVDQGGLPPIYLYSAALKFVEWGRAAPPAPMLTAVSAVAIDEQSGRLLFRLDDTRRRRPASTVKIMTAIVALARLGPATRLRVPDGVYSVTTDVGGSSMGVQPGEVFTLRDLLYGMLLPSGNDAAMTIATGAAGTPAAFVTLMNRMAMRLGLHNTHYTNAWGLDDVGEYTTASDLARLARYALTHVPLFATIVRTAHYTIPATADHPAFYLQNLNQLLGTYPGAQGVKTGTTPAAGENLVAAASRQHHSVIAVVLGSTDRYSDATSLLDYAFASWSHTAG